MIRLFIAGLVLAFSVAAAAAPLPCGGSGTGQTAAAYKADDGTILEACFDRKAGNVTVRLSGAEAVTLPSAISGSGARYSNGTLVFWEHQGTGRYFAGEKLLFEGKPVPSTGYAGGAAAKLLKQTMTTANGQKIVYPSTDKAEVTAMLVSIAPGGETGWHKHSIPVYAYMLTGEIEVELEDGSTTVYKAGDVIIEVLNTFHNGRNKGASPLSLIAFYVGVRDQPNVIRK